VNDQQLLRYSRHILLEELGIEGQQKFLDAHALVIGVGGLGSPAALYLAAAGVGRLTLVDGDTVDLTNLQRQILHPQLNIGLPKTLSGQAGLTRINPEVRIHTVQERVAGESLEKLIADADVVLDCSDNFATRHAINAACVRQHKALVSGAAVRFDGQLAIFDLRRLGQPDRGPCYACLFPEGDDVEALQCSTMGVFAPLTGIIGCMQAAEALKCLAGLPGTLDGRLQLLDARTMTWQSINVPHDPGCPVCGAGGDSGRAV